MSTADASSSSQTLVRFSLPEPPKRHPDEVTSYTFVHMTGNPHFLLPISPGPRRRSSAQNSFWSPTAAIVPAASPTC